MVADDVDMMAEGARLRAMCKPGRCPNDRSPDSLLSLQIEVRRLRATAKAANEGQERAIGEVARLRDQLSAALDIVDCPNDLAILPPPVAAVSTSVPVLLCSDWHCGAVVRPASVNGLKLGFAPERPQQLMRFIDSARGFTLSAPILTD